MVGLLGTFPAVAIRHSTEYTGNNAMSIANNPPVGICSEIKIYHAMFTQRKTKIGRNCSEEGCMAAA